MPEQDSSWREILGGIFALPGALFVFGTYKALRPELIPTDEAERAGYYFGAFFFPAFFFCLSIFFYLRQRAYNRRK